MAIVVDRSGNNPGNPSTNQYTGVDAHSKTLGEVKRDYYEQGTFPVYIVGFLAVTTAAAARTYLGTDNAANITSGVFDPARIPVINSAVQVVSASATIGGLSGGEQALVVAGCIVTTTDGFRWVYTGTGSKTNSASYIQLSDITPDWSTIQNKPVPATTIGGTATGGAGTVGTSANYAREDHAHQYPLADINAQTGTTYTLQASDHGRIVEIANAGAITLTLPNSLPIGFNCGLCQTGAGQITFTAAAGATIRQGASATKTAHQWSEAAIRVRTNSGANAEYVVSGDVL